MKKKKKLTRKQAEGLAAALAPVWMKWGILADVVWEELGRVKKPWDGDIEMLAEAVSGAHVERDIYEDAIQCASEMLCSLMEFNERRKAH